MRGISKGGGGGGEVERWCMGLYVLLIERVDRFRWCCK